jgi:glycosyltransferase involved in cell wall biosynthesis
VAEALAMAVPVITTTGTPWRAVQSGGLGWWVDPQVGALADALSAATSEPPSRLRERGIRAREYALSHFSWDAIGARMRACYDWMLDMGPVIPEIVFA